jgi:iron complex transport system ATP-binding protein
MRVAYVPQVHMTPFPYTVREVVTMGRLPRKSLLSSPSELDRDVVRGVLEKLKILHLADRVYSEISGGERQLALIARALAQEAPTLILDEPLANLDFGYQVVLAQRLKDLARDGHAILMTGHDPQFAYQASSRVALLVDGRLEQDGPPQQILTSVAIRRLYGIDVECIPLAGGRVAFFLTDKTNLCIRRGIFAACHKQKPPTAKQQYFLENSELLSRVCWYFGILTMTVFALHLVKPSSRKYV